MDRIEDQDQRSDFPPIRVGRRFIVVPARFESPLESERIPIRIDPGMAFGTGEHPTTRLCLMALERHLIPGAAVLDLGTGTGILSIAAVKLGSGPVLAVDTDPEAVRVARENAAANRVAEMIRVEEGSLGNVLAAQFGTVQTSLVIANILAHVITGFFEQGLTHAVTPGGLLILSGLLRTQTPEIMAHLQWEGLQLLAQEQSEEWVCIIARQP